MFAFQKLKLKTFYLQLCQEMRDQVKNDPESLSKQKIYTENICIK